MVTQTLFLPTNHSIAILKKDSYLIILYNHTYLISWQINQILFFNKISNCITIQKLQINELILYLNSFFYSYSIVNLTLIKFKGKGFKLTKKKQVVNFLFNFSHLSYYFPIKSTIKKLTKNKFLVFTASRNTLTKISNFIKQIKQINVYSLNGLRVKRQLIYKRKGKTISS